MKSSETISKRQVARLENEANALAAKEQWREAATTLERVTRGIPHDTARWLLVAQWQRRARDFEAAVHTLQDALQHPESSTRSAADDTLLRQALAETQHEAQQWDECIETCRVLLQSEPRNHNAREILATALLHAERIDEAVQVLRELLLLSPRDPLHRLKLATLLQLQGKSGEALCEFERVVAAYPDAPFADEAREAVDMLDNLQIQQVLMRMSEDAEFARYIQSNLDLTLAVNDFYLTDEGRESLRHMMSDGRPEH
jgi:tetratricopeptide (TPR) repeat protein